MGREGGRKGDEYILLTMVLFTRWRPLSLEPKARCGAGDRGMGEWGREEARERDCHNLATPSSRRWFVPTKRFSLVPFGTWLARADIRVCVAAVRIYCTVYWFSPSPGWKYFFSVIANTFLTTCPFCKCIVWSWHLILFCAEFSLVGYWICF